MLLSSVLPSCIKFVGYLPLLILLLSIFIAPVSCSSTFFTIVFSDNGFLATKIGSCAGFKAVPQPSHFEKPFVFSTNDEL